MASRIIPCLAAAILLGAAHAASAQTVLFPMQQMRPPPSFQPPPFVQQPSVPLYQAAPLIGQGMFPMAPMPPPPPPMVVMPWR